MRYNEEMQLTLDIDWFAIDKEGNVAHFASAGGLLPESVCTSKEDNERLLEFFKSLPIINKDVILNDEMIKSNGLMTMEDVERHFRDFIFMSHRGLFSFDKKVLGQFEETIMLLVAKPLSPLSVNDLPIDIQEIVSRTKVEDDLNEVKEIDVAKFF